MLTNIKTRYRRKQIVYGDKAPNDVLGIEDKIQTHIETVPTIAVKTKEIDLSNTANTISMNDCVKSETRSDLDTKVYKDILAQVDTMGIGVLNKLDKDQLTYLYFYITDKYIRGNKSDMIKRISKELGVLDSKPTSAWKTKSLKKS